MSAEIHKATLAHATAAIYKYAGFPAGNLPCEGYHCTRTDAARQRQNTAYVDDAQNWVTLCPECAKENAEHWAEMWADYYSNCM